MIRKIGPTRRRLIDPAAFRAKLGAGRDLRGGSLILAARRRRLPL